MVGEFEYLILSAAAHLGEEAYGAAMREVIETTGGRTCSLGALYTTLDRLESQGAGRNVDECANAAARRSSQTHGEGDGRGRSRSAGVLRGRNSNQPRDRLGRGPA